MKVRNEEMGKGRKKNGKKEDKEVTKIGKKRREQILAKQMREEENCSRIYMKKYIIIL